MDGRATDSRVFEEALADTRARFVAALSRGDAKAAATVYAEQAWLLPPWTEPMQGRDAIEAFWCAGLAAGIATLELDARKLVSDERLAYEIGHYRLRLEPPEDSAVVERGSYLLVHALQPDGSWRRAVEMFSPNGPPVLSGRGFREAMEG